MEKPHSFSAKLLNGAIAGVVGVTCTFPLDLAKTRLQDQRNLGAQKQYKHLVDCLWKVARAEGVRGLYKGMGVNLLLINPEKAIKLAVNDQVRQMYGGKRHTLPLSKEMIAGAAAGFCQVIVTTPMEMLKIQLQMAGTQTSGPRVANGASAVAAASTNLRTFGTKSGTPPKSAARIAQDLMRSKGISGLYKGLGATLARDVPFSCIYFPLFAFLRLEFQPGGTHSENPGALHCLLAGCLAGLTGSAAVTPLDVVKTRLQVIRSGQGEATYNGFVDCVQKTYTNEGIRAFFKGAVPRMVVIAPLFGIAQMVYFLGVAERIMGLEI